MKRRGEEAGETYLFMLKKINKMITLKVGSISMRMKFVLSVKWKIFHKYVTCNQLIKNIIMSAKKKKTKKKKGITPIH